MATNKSTRAEPAQATDRKEGMRRAQLAFDALERGAEVPLEARMPDRGGPPLPAAQAKVPLASQAPGVPGIIYSQPGKPPAAVVRDAKSKAAGSDMRLTHQGSAFDRLKMGQQRLGRPVERIGERPSEGGATGSADSAAGKARALGKEAFSDIHRASRVAHVVALVRTVGAYYKSTPAELHGEVTRLSALSTEELHVATQAYEFTANQVLVMTDGKHAQKLARESSKEVRDFYEKHGTTEDTIESERLAAMPLTPAPRRR